MQPTCKTRTQHADPPDKTAEQVVLQVDLPESEKPSERSTQTDKSTTHQSTTTSSAPQTSGSPPVGPKSHSTPRLNSSTSLAFLLAIIATLLGIMLGSIIVFYVYLGVATQFVVSTSLIDLSNPSIPEPGLLKNHKSPDEFSTAPDVVLPSHTNHSVNVTDHENASETAEHLTNPRTEALTGHLPFVYDRDNFPAKPKVPFPAPIVRQTFSTSANREQFSVPYSVGNFDPEFEQTIHPKISSTNYGFNPFRRSEELQPDLNKGHDGNLDPYPSNQPNTFSNRQGYLPQFPSNNKHTPFSFSNANNNKRLPVNPVPAFTVPQYSPTPKFTADRGVIRRPNAHENRPPLQHVPTKPMTSASSPFKEERQRGPVPMYVAPPPRFRPSNVDYRDNRNSPSRIGDRTRVPNANYNYPRDASNIQDIISYMTTIGHGSSTSTPLSSSSLNTRPVPNKYDYDDIVFKTNSKPTSNSNTRNRYSSSTSSSLGSNSPKTFAVMLDVYPVEEGRNTFRASGSQTRPQQFKPSFQSTSLNSQYYEEEEPIEDNKHQIVLHLNLYPKKPHNQRNNLGRRGEIAFSQAIGSLAPADIYQAIFQGGSDNRRDYLSFSEDEMEDVAMSRDQVQIELYPYEKVKNLTFLRRPTTTTPEPEIVEGFDPIQDLPLQENHRFYESGEDYRNKKVTKVGLSSTPGSTRETTTEYQEEDDEEPEELPRPWPQKAGTVLPQSTMESDLFHASDGPLSDGMLITSELFE